MGTDNNKEAFLRAVIGTSACAYAPTVVKLDTEYIDMKSAMRFSKYIGEIQDEIIKKQRDRQILEIVREALVPKRILRSGNRTIVFWEDGSKTIVKLCEDCEDNPYDAFTAALAKKIFGTNSALKRMIAKTLEYR